MEGKTSVLTGTSSGVPESLKSWLKDAEIKIFATKGHREKVRKYCSLCFIIRFYFIPLLDRFYIYFSVS